MVSGPFSIPYQRSRRIGERSSCFPRRAPHAARQSSPRLLCQTKLRQHARPVLPSADAVQHDPFHLAALGLDTNVFCPKSRNDLARADVFPPQLPSLQGPPDSLGVDNDDCFGPEPVYKANGEDHGQCEASPKQPGVIQDACGDRKKKLRNEKEHEVQVSYTPRDSVDVFRLRQYREPKLKRNGMTSCRLLRDSGDNEDRPR